MRAARGISSQGRHADLAYALDRSLKDPCSVAEFSKSAIDVLRLALRPAYAATFLRAGGAVFHSGDKALVVDLVEMTEILAAAPRSLVAHPRTLTRRETSSSALKAFHRAMTASALELAYPIVCDGAVLGVMVLGPRASGRPYTNDDVELCDRVGARLALMAGKAEVTGELARLRAASAGTEHLASVGQMAAGLAHEIRNPLVSIRTFTQLLPERYGDEEYRSSFLDLTLAEIDRISTLVGELLSFARPSVIGGAEEAGTDVGDCLARTCLLLKTQARGAGVALECETADELPRAAIGEDKLRQVVINLVLNAVQACGDKGRVDVRAASMSAPDAVRVEVADDGPGMDASIAARIFDPFFTTRREGTGLGLAVAKRIVEDHGGRIEVFTAPEKGTRFAIEVPTVAAARAAACERKGESRGRTRQAELRLDG